MKPGQKVGEKPRDYFQGSVAIWRLQLWRSLAASCQEGKGWYRPVMGYQREARALMSIFISSLKFTKVIGFNTSWSECLDQDTRWIFICNSEQVFKLSELQKNLLPCPLQIHEYLQFPGLSHQKPRDKTSRLNSDMLQSERWHYLDFMYSHIQKMRNAYCAPGTALDLDARERMDVEMVSGGAHL